MGNFCPLPDHRHFTNPQSLQQSVYWEVNCKGKQTKESYISLCKSILFGFNRKNKTCLLKNKDFCTTFHLPTELQVKMWKLCVYLKRSCNSLLFLATPGGVSVLGTVWREQTQGQATLVQEEHNKAVPLQHFTPGQRAAATRQCCPEIDLHRNVKYV